MKEMRWDGRIKKIQWRKWNEMNWIFLLFWKINLELKATAAAYQRMVSKKKKSFLKCFVWFIISIFWKKGKKISFLVSFVWLVVVAHLDAWWWWWWFPIRIRPRMKKKWISKHKDFWNNLTKRKKNKKTNWTKGENFVRWVFWLLQTHTTYTRKWNW